MSERVAVAQYKPGETFICTKRLFSPDSPSGVTDPCGAEVKIHGYWWCGQVCPVCLANYHVGGAAKMELFLDYGGFYPPDVAARVRANIAANGGQYIPTFERS